MEAIAIPMPLWWRLLGRLYAFALRLIPQEKQQTKADDRAGQMAADALDTYGNAILRCAYSYLHNMADAEEVFPIVESTFPHGRSSERPACLSQWYRPPAAGSDPARP